jgi:hypothetical protein
VLSSIELTFRSGSRIYYYARTADPGGVYLRGANGYTFQDGLNVDATVRLTFGTTLDLRFTLNAVDGRLRGLVGGKGRPLRHLVDRQSHEVQRQGQGFVRQDASTH